MHRGLMYAYDVLRAVSHRNIVLSGLLEDIQAGNISIFQVRNILRIPKESMKRLSANMVQKWDIVSLEANNVDKTSAEVNYHNYASCQNRKYSLHQVFSVKIKWLIY